MSLSSQDVARLLGLGSPVLGVDTCTVLAVFLAQAQRIHDVLKAFGAQGNLQVHHLIMRTFGPSRFEGLR